MPYNIIKPVRHVVSFTVDHNHLKRPPPFGSHPPEPVDLCVVKRTSLSLCSLRERWTYQKVRWCCPPKHLVLDFELQEIPLPQGGTIARRVGRTLCIADKVHYNMVDLDSAMIFPLIPLSQAEDTSVAIKPFITVVSDNEFLLLSWTGSGTIGVFLSTDGDPTRGTLEWPCHPESICKFRTIM